jgi:hypothetical protein
LHSGTKCYAFNIPHFFAQLTEFFFDDFRQPIKRWKHSRRGEKMVRVVKFVALFLGEIIACDLSYLNVPNCGDCIQTEVKFRIAKS